MSSLEEVAELRTLWVNCDGCGELVTVDDVEIDGAEVLCSSHGGIVDRLKRRAGDWCDVTFAEPGEVTKTRRMMPRHPTPDIALDGAVALDCWRFTDRDTGMEWFIRARDVQAVTPA